MMLNELAKKHSQNFRPIANDKVAMEIGDELSYLSEADLKEAAFEDQTVGRVIFYKSDKHPNVVLELIAGSIANDSQVTIYETNGIFAQRGAYASARKELMVAVGRVFGAGDNYMNVAIQDNSRNRKVLLTELGTAQLIDILNDSERHIQLS